MCVYKFHKFMTLCCHESHLTLTENLLIYSIYILFIYIIQYTQYLYTVYSIHSIYIQYTVYTVFIYSIQHTQYLYTVYSIHSIYIRILYTVYTIQYSIYSMNTCMHAPECILNYHSSNELPIVIHVFDVCTFVFVSNMNSIY